MKARSKIYFWRKSAAGKAHIRMIGEVYASFAIFGMAGTYVGKDEAGNVICRVLSYDEMVEIKQLKEKGEEIPFEKTIMYV